MKKMWYVLVQSGGKWRTITKTYDKTRLERAVIDLRFKSHVVVTSCKEIGRAGKKGISNKVVVAAYKRALVKFVERVPEPQVMRVSLSRLKGKGLAAGRQVMSLGDAVDLLWSSPQVLAFLKSFLRRELAAGRSFRTHTGLWRAVGPKDDLRKAKGIVYVRKSRFGSFVEMINR